MNDDHDEIARLLAAIEEPEPPGTLRGRALAHAAQAWHRPPAVDRWRLMWESRPLRLAWAATVVILMAANVALRSGPRARQRAASPAVAAREQAGLEELQAIVELPRLRPEYAGIDAHGGRAARPGGSNLTLQHHDPEDKS